MILLVAGSLAAQAAPASQQVMPTGKNTPANTKSAPAKPVAPAPAKTAPKTTPTTPKMVLAQAAKMVPARPAPAKKTPEQLKSEIEAAVAKKMAEQPASAAQTASAEEAKKAFRGKRDPFVSPIVEASRNKTTVQGCATGKRCLVIDQIVLKGIIQMKGGNIALVENTSKRPYVLHEKDSVFNGLVEKITGDSIVFRESVTDLLGHTSSKEVVKKVSAPAV
jgi:Tfp pilus assembly protein PilP